MKIIAFPERTGTQWEKRDLLFIHEPRSAVHLREIVRGCFSPQLSIRLFTLIRGSE